MQKSQKGRQTAAELTEERARRTSVPGRSENPIGEYGRSARNFYKGTGPVSRKGVKLKPSRD